MTLPGPFMKWNQEVANQAKIVWVREPKTTVVAAVPAAWGGGRILFSQLDLQRRVGRSQRDYDLVAERILLKLQER